MFCSAAALQLIGNGHESLLRTDLQSQPQELQPVRRLKEVIINNNIFIISSNRLPRNVQSKVKVEKSTLQLRGRFRPVSGAPGRPAETLITAEASDMRMQTLLTSLGGW